MRKAFLIVTTLVMFGPMLWAQNNCRALRAMGQAQLFGPVILREGDTWGGHVYGSIGALGPNGALDFYNGNGVLLVGRFSGTDGDTVGRGVPSLGGIVGLGRGGSYIFDFGAMGSFETSVTNAVFPYPLGKGVIGYYQASHKIVSGTGSFANTTGSFVLSGPFFGWWDEESGTVLAYWNPEITRTICGLP